ncbi:NF-kappa-B inhibitor zeta [Halichoeres trimaculatus]|uniref:NF-kappa-B inhibitor zeta n=1 Tax=Halichoeres trimaculatus TaxID=147232 RepID=UPI003D9F6AA0
MLDQRGNETRGGQVLSAGSDFIQDDRESLHTDHRPPEYMQSLHKKNTVKELLMMKRQRWHCSQDNTEHKVKIAKYAAFGNDSNHHPLNTSVMSDYASAAPESGPVLHQVQHPPVQGAGAEVRMSLFQWQIQQEAQRVGGLSPELLNMQDSDGDTFLHIAVAQGKRALTFVLAAKMANCGSLDMKEHNGQTALQIAAAINQPLIVQDLLGHGAQVNTRDLWGRSPLHVCAEKGHFLSLQSIWRTLTGSGKPIDVDLHNYDGLTPLHAAVLSHNTVVREHRSEGNSCSHRAMEQLQRRQMYVECVKTLLLMGASCGAKDLKSGRTCLHMAAEEANVELLHIFLNDPSSLSIINIKTFSGNTALHVVSSLRNRNTQVEAAKLLMRKGADPGIRNFENDLPSQLAPEGAVGEKVRKILKGKYCHA